MIVLNQEARVTELSSAQKEKVYLSFCEFGMLTANDTMQSMFNHAEVPRWRICVESWVNWSCQSDSIGYLLGYDAIMEVVQELYQQKLQKHRDRDLNTET